MVAGPSLHSKTIAEVLLHRWQSRITFHYPADEKEGHVGKEQHGKSGKIGEIKQGNDGGAEDEQRREPEQESNQPQTLQIIP